MMCGGARDSARPRGRSGRLSIPRRPRLSWSWPRDSVEPAMVFANICVSWPSMGSLCSRAPPRVRRGDEVQGLVDDVALVLGVAGLGDQQRAQYLRERQTWRRVVAESATRRETVQQEKASKEFQDALRRMRTLARRQPPPNLLRSTLQPPPQVRPQPEDVPVLSRRVAVRVRLTPEQSRERREIRSAPVFSRRPASGDRGDGAVHGDGVGSTTSTPGRGTRVALPARGATHDIAP